MSVYIGLYIFQKILQNDCAIDLSEQQALDTDPKAIQQINFTENLDRANNTRLYFILEEAKETGLDFSQGTLKVLQMQSHWLESMT